MKQIKQILLSMSLSLLILGCGGGGGSEGGETSASIPSDSYGPNSYSTTSYMIPSISTDSINTRSIHTTSYNATYRSLDTDTVIETPQNSNGESIKYKKIPNYIKVTLRDANGQDLYSYKLKQTIRLGESITSPESSCIFVNSFSQKYLNNTSYKNVIEVDCGQHKAYYAKGEGLVYKE